jgi:small conductance mechanosensitive channel
MGVFADLSALVQPLYTKIILATIIVFLGLIVGKIVAKLVQKVLAELELDRGLLKSGIGIRVESLLSSFLQYIIYILFGVWALETMGLGSVVLNIIAGGIVVIIIVSLLLGIKDFVPNAMAGVFIHMRGYLKKGDWVKVDTTEGHVLDVDIAETKIETKGGDVLFVPNAVFLRNKFLIKKEHSTD